MAEVKLEEWIVLASSSLSCLLRHHCSSICAQGIYTASSDVSPSLCLCSLGIPTESRIESRHMKNSGWKTQHHFYLCDRVGFPVFGAKPQRCQPKANQGCSVPCTACGWHGLLVSLTARLQKQGAFCCSCWGKAGSLCWGLESVSARL